jgi:hypothetical protein
MTERWIVSPQSHDVRVVRYDWISCCIIQSSNFVVRVNDSRTSCPKLCRTHDPNPVDFVNITPTIRWRECQKRFLRGVDAFKCPCDDSREFVVVGMPILALSFIDTSSHRSLFSTWRFPCANRKPTLRNALSSQFWSCGFTPANTCSYNHFSRSKSIWHRHWTRFPISQVNGLRPSDIKRWWRHAKCRFCYSEQIAPKADPWSDSRMYVDKSKLKRLLNVK